MIFVEEIKNYFNHTPKKDILKEWKKIQHNYDFGPFIENGPLAQ